MKINQYNDRITFSRGLYFPRPVIFVGFLIILIGFVSLSESILLAVLVDLVGIILAFTRWGVQVDPIQKQLRSFVTLFGLRVGKWSSYSEYPFVAILRGRTAQTTYGGSASIPVTTNSKYYSITLLSSSHRERYELDQYKTIEAAENLIDDVARLMGVERTVYSPTVTSSTARRRRR